MNNRTTSSDEHPDAKGPNPESREAYPLLPGATQPHPLAAVIQTYLLALRDIGQTVRIVMPHLSKWQLDEVRKHEKKLEQFAPSPKNNGESQDITVDSARDFAELISTLRTLEELHASKALPVLARSLFMQIFCEFDAFIGSLLTVIYIKNQDLLKGISREITLRELFEHESLDSVKRAMLNKEIETFRRDSYVEQFANLEKKFQITLRKFDEWGEFVELSQRRNIFTHNDGMVSDQYLTVCDREGWKFPRRPLVGSTLNVELGYFGRALQVMSKVGFMLAHTLWSKVFPKELDDMHESINDRLYECLENKRWKTAAELGSFGLSDAMKRGASEITLRIRTINLAIGLKFAERQDEAYKLLDRLDWTASYRDFRLAILVLHENYDEAVKLMRSIGKSGELLEQSSYYTWPLFHRFRERPEFYAVYEEIYGEPYSTQVPTDGKSTNVSVSEAAVHSGDKAKASPAIKVPKKKVSRRSASIVSKKRITTKRGGAASQETPDN